MTEAKLTIAFGALCSPPSQQLDKHFGIVDGQQVGIDKDREIMDVASENITFLRIRHFITPGEADKAFGRLVKFIIKSITKPQKGCGKHGVDVPFPPVPLARIEKMNNKNYINKR